RHGLHHVECGACREQQQVAAGARIDSSLRATSRWITAEGSGEKPRTPIRAAGLASTAASASSAARGFRPIAFLPGGARRLVSSAAEQPLVLPSNGAAPSLDSDPEREGPA